MKTLVVIKQSYKGLFDLRETLVEVVNLIFIEFVSPGRGRLNGYFVICVPARATILIFAAHTARFD